MHVRIPLEKPGGGSTKSHAKSQQVLTTPCLMTGVTLHCVKSLTVIARMSG